MPLATRYVEPRSVCSNPLLPEEETRAGDALQAVAVRSLAGVIRQLGSLARHAESVMGELAESLAIYHARTQDLERRTRVLAKDILPQLDPDREVLEGFEIPHPDLQFKSNTTIDQRILSQKKHVPAALLEQYNQARAPPDLTQFSSDWDDVMNAMHFYSNPNFFFEYWRGEIQKQTMRKISQIDMLSPKHEGHGGKKKRRHILEGSGGSDKVSSSSRPVKRTFSLSKRPNRRSIHGSSQSLNTDPGGYSTMPSYPGRQGLPRRSSPSFHSSNSHVQRRNPVARTQSVRNRDKRRSKHYYALAPRTASLYVEPDIQIILPDLKLEENSEYEYDARPHKKTSSSALRRSHSFQKSRSKSPAVSSNSVLDSMHMYTVAEELSKLRSSPFSVISKQHREQLDLGSANFDTSVKDEKPIKKEEMTFRTPIGIKQRPVSSLDLQLVVMRNDGLSGSRSSVARSRHLSAADIPNFAVPHPPPPSSLDPQMPHEDQDNFPGASNGPMFGIGGIVLRRRISMTGPNSQPRPVSASFIDPPTVKKLQNTSRMSLQAVQGGSLTDLTRPDSPTLGSGGSSSPKLRPKRLAPQAPVGGRPPSRTSTPESGRSTPKGYRTQSPLVGSGHQSHSTHSQPQSSSETITAMSPNGRGTPLGSGRGTPVGSPIIGNHVMSPGSNRSNAVAAMRLPGLQRQTSSPLISSPPQLPSLSLSRNNTSSPQLPLMIAPIQEEEVLSPLSTSHHHHHYHTTPPQIITPSSPPVTTTPMMMNGRVPVPSPGPPPPPLLRRDSLYVSPRKQTLSLSSADKKRQRASQILETGGIRGGDLSNSRMDLLDAIRKGIQLKEVEKQEREKENLVNLPWDVATILERRLALESDSDSSEEEGESINDSEWEDEDD